jgi:hypothetical protein
MTHHPAIYRARRYGTWGQCACGWISAHTYTTVTGAHLAFGQHLLDTRKAQ